MVEAERELRAGLLVSSGGRGECTHASDGTHDQDGTRSVALLARSRTYRQNGTSVTWGFPLDAASIARRAAAAMLSAQTMTCADENKSPQRPGTTYLQ